MIDLCNFMLNLVNKLTYIRTLSFYLTVYSGIYLIILTFMSLTIFLISLIYSSIPCMISVCRLHFLHKLQFVTTRCLIQELSAKQRIFSNLVANSWTLVKYLQFDPVRDCYLFIELGTPIIFMFNIVDQLE